MITTISEVGGAVAATVNDLPAARFTLALPFAVSPVRVPTLVMLGWAAVVTVPAVVAVAAAKFATVVVEVTTRGAVPVAMFEINCGAVTFAVART